MTEPTRNWLSLNDTDLTPYTRSADFTYTADEVADEAAWGEYLAGLQPGQLSLSGNWQGDFTPFGDAHFPASPPTYRVSYELPDGRWQAAKHWLQRHGLKWLKVRWAKYSFEAELDLPEGKPGDALYDVSIPGRTVGPITKQLEER